MPGFDEFAVLTHTRDRIISMEKKKNFNIPSFKKQRRGRSRTVRKGKGKLVPGHLQATWERHDAAVAASYGHKSRNS